MKSEVSTTVVGPVSAINKDPWQSLVARESPFLEYSFLAGLEESGCVGPGTGWEPRIIIASIDDELVGAAPLYLKEHSAGEFVFDWAWADAAHRAGIPYYPKAVVAVPFTPVTGARLLVSPAWLSRREEIKTALIKACLALASEENLSSLHFNFIPEEDQALFQNLDLPIRMGMQYHWQNEGFEDFDDYLSGFRSKKRANLRRERRKLEESGVRTAVLRGDEISDRDLRFAFAFYRDTIQKFFYGQQYLNEAFFLSLQEGFRENLHFVFLYEKDDNVPFGGTFNLQKEDRLYGRYWGALKDVPYAHFEACIYRPVEWAIENGIQFFEPGAGGEHKYDRGFTPTPTFSAHYIRHPALRRGVKEFLAQERLHMGREIQARLEASPITQK